MQQNLQTVLEEHKQKEENEAMTAKSQLESIQILVSEKTEMVSTVARLQKELQDLTGENAVITKSYGKILAFVQL